MRIAISLFFGPFSTPSKHEIFICHDKMSGKIAGQLVWPFVLGKVCFFFVDQAFWNRPKDVYEGSMRTE